MATIQQSLGVQNRIASAKRSPESPSQRSVTAIMAIKALVKHTDIVKNVMKKEGGIGRNGNSGGGVSNKEINDIISILKSIKSNVSKIEDYTASMNNMLSNFKKNTEKLLEKLQPKTSDNLNKWTSIVNSLAKIIAVGVSAGIASFLLMQEGGLGSVREHLDKSIDEKLFGQTESETTATTPSDKQAIQVVPTMVDQQKKLNARLNALATEVNTWQTNREIAMQDDRQTELNKRLDTLVGGIEEWRANRTVPTATNKQDKLNTRLNALATGIEQWRSGRKDSKEGISRSDMLVKEFKDTITGMAGFLKTTFEDPAKAVEKQFLHMGVVSIFILRQMEAAIASVASALGSLQSTAITLVSSVQDAVPKAEKDLQYVPSAEKSLGAPVNAESSPPYANASSKQSSINMQQSADAYEISSQKAGEITAMSGNQAGSRQTIINMNSNMPVNASITNGMDMETFLRQLGIGVDMAMRSAAEGVPL